MLTCTCTHYSPTRKNKGNALWEAHIAAGMPPPQHMTNLTSACQAPFYLGAGITPTRQTSIWLELHLESQPNISVTRISSRHRHKLLHNARCRDARHSSHRAPCEEAIENPASRMQQPEHVPKACMPMLILLARPLAQKTTRHSMSGCTLNAIEASLASSTMCSTNYYNVRPWHGCSMGHLECLHCRTDHGVQARSS